MAEVQILGHKAKIVRVSGKPRLDWERRTGGGTEDMLMVQVEFDPPVEGIVSIGISVPATAGAGTLEEFLAAVVNEGSRQLAETLRTHREEGESQLARTRRQGELDLVAQRISQELELEL